MTTTSAPAVVNGVRSKARVKDLGEVFTQPREVNAMLDLIPADVWQNPLAKFLEPSCGDGNFLEAILRRKLDSLGARIGNTTAHAEMFGTLCTVASIYAVDISAPNVADARARLRRVALEWVERPTPAFLDLLDTIIDANIQVANFLEGDAVMTDWTTPAPGAFVAMRYQVLKAGSVGHTPVGEPELHLFFAAEA